MNSKSSPSTTFDGTWVVRRVRPFDLKDTPVLPIVLNLLDMHHHLGQVHVFMEHRIPTLLFQFLVDSSKEPAHLFPTIRHKNVAYLEKLTNLREYTLTVI